MVASGWSHVVPYYADLNTALRDLQEGLFRDEDYYWYDDDERPTSLTELWRLLSQTDLGAIGTHSILDVDRVGDGDEKSDFGSIRPLTAAERQRWFGTDTPTRADYDNLHDNIEFHADPPRWSGRCVVLYRDGKPDEIAFWEAPETETATMRPMLQAEHQLNLDRARVEPLRDVLRLWFAEGVRLLFGPVVEALKTAPPLKIVSDRDEPDPPGKMYGQVKLDRHVDGRIRRSRKVFSDKNLEAFLSNLDDTLDHADVSLIHMDDTRDGCRLSASLGFSDANLILLNCYMPVTWLEDAAYERALLEFARTTAHVSNPLYGQIGYYRATFDTAYDDRLRFNPPSSVVETEAELRGHDWLTIVPESLGQKLGGRQHFESSGAFTEVVHLDRGGYFLLATPTFADYDIGAAEKVFDAVAPLLRAGMPHEPDPLRPPTYIVMRDAAQYRQRH